MLRKITLLSLFISIFLIQGCYSGKNIPSMEKSDAVAPSVSNITVLTPNKDGSGNVSGDISISVIASDNIGVTQVQVQFEVLNGSLKKTVTCAKTQEPKLILQV